LINEKIVLDKAFDNLDIDSLSLQIPSDKGRFHLFRFDHKHENEQFKSIIFIYSMPGFICSVKERMLYSSCKSELLSYLKSKNICPIKTLEIGEPNDLTKNFLIEELHPKKFVIFKTESLRQPSLDLTSSSKLEGTAVNGGAMSRGIAARRVTFHEDTKADNSWINTDLLNESSTTPRIPIKQRAYAAPLSHDKKIKPEKANENSTIHSDTFLNSLLNSILNNNLFFVLLIGLLILSISILVLRFIASQIKNF
jgi:hypothetical protein